MISVKRKIQIRRRSNRTCAVVVAADNSPATVPTGRVPRISRLMALAIHFDRLIREGKVRDQSELARLVHVTQPRMTQIMNLNMLAPDIQEELLLGGREETGRCSANERLLRPVARLARWSDQRILWSRLKERII